jgi:ABC-type polysaccharide/polyol phosphate transport system ATPase subunit
MSSIILKNVSLSYPLLGAYSRSLKQSMMSVLARGTSQITSQNNIIYVEALKNISFELARSDRLGLIGPNGSGKSTLLKIIAGIYPPSSGTIHTEGSISPLLGINVGMNPLATGYENIRFRSLLYGFDKKKIQKIIEDVEEFTQLGHFLAMPVKTYSSGMSVRLSFGIATAITPDILILDEVVGAGDAQFINKARQRLSQLIESSNILVLASHSEEIIKKFCNKILWLEQGSIVKFSEQNIDETLNEYKGSCLALSR